MKIYIASSWKNQHGVELLTDRLRRNNFEVISWIENNTKQGIIPTAEFFDFDDWMRSDESDQSFEFDTTAAMTCDVFIYYGPAGKDAAAECGMCYAQRLHGKRIPMFALWAKGEDFGLMRKMFDKVFTRYQDLIPELFDVCDDLSVKNEEASHE